MSDVAVTRESPGDGSASVTRSRSCDGCGEVHAPARADARYCSGACRQRAYRERHQSPRPTRKRRPIADSWRDATADLRRAAERVQRLMRDDRFADNLPRLFQVGVHDMLAASYVVGEYEVAIKELPRKFRATAVVTRDSPCYGSASVTAECAGDGSSGGGR